MIKEIVVYHGSNKIVDKPKYGLGKLHNDYGQGFYCTRDKELSKEWAVTEDSDGYSNKYLLNLHDLMILDLDKYNILYWITILIKNRKFILKNDISRRGYKYLLEKYNLDLSAYDVVIGYRADDSYFTYAESFLNNTIGIKKLSNALKLGKLGKQIVLISKKAFLNIKFVSFEIANHDEYYELRALRNKEAKLEYFDDKNNYDDDIYLNDIIRGADINGSI